MRRETNSLCIAFVFDIFLPAFNGVISVTLDLARELKQRGYRIIFLAPKRDEAPISYEGIPVYYFTGRRAYFYPELYLVSLFNRQVKTILTHEKVDLVHITAPANLGLLAIWAARKQNIPVVHTWHTMLNDTLYIKKLVLFSFLVPLAQYIGRLYYRLFIKNITLTAPSRVSERFLRSCDSDAEIYRIPNGIKLSEFTSVFSRRALICEYPFFSQKIFLYAGRMSAEKSIDHLIKAFALCAQRYDDVHLLLIGEGPDLKDLQSLSHELVVDGRVHFIGKIPRDDLIQKGFFAHAYAFVNASTSENAGTSLTESICSQTPIVSYNDMATEDVVGDAGLLVPVGDHRALAGAMGILLEDELLYKKLKEACSKRKKIFDSKRVATLFEELYHSIINKDERIRE